MNKPLIVITTGEPGGIGPDICLDIPEVTDFNLLLIGDIHLLQCRAQVLNKKISLKKVSLQQVVEKDLSSAKAEILVLHIPCVEPGTLGKANTVNASYVLKILDIAVDLCKANIASGMLTAPVSKEVINEAGYKFSGHTEYLAAKFSCDKVVMMLSNPLMKVALLTTHLPLKDVAKQVTHANLDATLKIIVRAFQTYYKIENPRIGVCGLNPHAGEGGYLGTEEINIINPTIKHWQGLGFHVSGTYPADTIFNNLDDFDVILAMYHDQGLPVLKYADFENGINITLGLPILRASVDHGTALSLAGTGLASSKSLRYALHQIILLAKENILCKMQSMPNQVE